MSGWTRDPFAIIWWPQMETDIGKFAFSIWSAKENGKHITTGKHFSLNSNGELEKGSVNLRVNEMFVESVNDLAELAALIDDTELRHSFFTPGVPVNWATLYASGSVSRVTLKSQSERVKKNTVQRTKKCLSGISGIGSYLVVDFDPDACPWQNLPNIEDLHRRMCIAARLGGLELDNCQALTYKSSSSSIVRKSDGYSFDKGGRHLIYLIDDVSDLDRFVKDLSIYLALTGSCYGALSKVGSFLKRGILDVSAVMLHQPTFVAPANFGNGLRLERDIKIIGGDQTSIDTKKLRRPSEEQTNAAKAFWYTEFARLKPDSDKKKSKYIENQVSKLAPQLAENTPVEVIKDLVKRRLEGRLLGPDEITTDNGDQIRIADILANPSQYDGLTCADPVEPDYGGGKNIAIFYANPESGQPILFSQAHGGINYQLLFDRETALVYFDQLSPKDRIHQINRVMNLLYTEDNVEAEFLLKEIAKLSGTTKKAMSSSYSQILQINRASRGPVDSDDHELDDCASIDSLEYQAASELLEQQNIASTSGSGGYELWIYTGKYWRYYEDAEALQELTKILSEKGWSKESGKITRVAQEALSSLKVQSFQLNPTFRREVQHIINCANGEVWFLPNGEVELRPHSPDSGLTHVLDVDYDPDATSHLFLDSIVQMFLPPAHQFKKTSPDEQKQINDEAERMARYITEILAYFLVPRRWLTNWFLFIGNGSNGKTLLMKIIQLLIPEDSVVNERLQSISDTEFGTARIRDKILLIDDDLATGITLPDGFLKKVSESKRLSANVKNYPRDVSFNNRCALVLLTNNYPRLKDISHGTTRRVRAIEFPRRFYSVGELSQLPVNQKKKHSGDAADPELLEKLKLELPGILNTLVKAYRDLCRRKDFDIPLSAKQTTKKVLIMAHPLEQFIEEHCTEGEDRYVLRTQFHTNLLQFNIEQENKWRPTIPQIRTEMEQLGYPVKKKRMEDGSVPEVYNGLGLKDSPPISLVPEKPLKKKVK